MNEASNKDEALFSIFSSIVSFWRMRQKDEPGSHVLHKRPRIMLIFLALSYKCSKISGVCCYIHFYVVLRMKLVAYYMLGTFPTEFPCPVPLIFILSLLSLIFCFFVFILTCLGYCRISLNCWLISDINLKMFFFSDICFSTTHLPFNSFNYIPHISCVFIFISV